MTSKDAAENDVAWDDWVSATATRNYIVGATLNDWLNLYGPSIGHIPDNQLPDFDPRTDFRTFFYEQGRTFEDRVVDCLRERVQVERGARDHRDITDPAFAERTRALMAAGTPIIHKAVLHDPEHRVYGEADLLIRSDTFLELFPDAITADEATTTARWGGSGAYLPALEERRHSERYSKDGLLPEADRLPVVRRMASGGGDDELGC